jgi:hypothetical protein
MPVSSRLQTAILARFALQGAFATGGKKESAAIRLARVPEHVRDAAQGNGEDVKVVQELMRHANISVTLKIARRPSRKPSETRRAEL